MTVSDLIELLKYAAVHDPAMPVTVLGHEGEYPLRTGAPIVTLEGGGASPRFVAINVEG